MSVIRTLSASETNEQREKERAKLEKEYKKSDARLDELVAAHAQEIMEVMQVQRYYFPSEICIQGSCSQQPLLPMLGIFLWFWRTRHANSYYVTLSLRNYLPL